MIVNDELIVAFVKNMESPFDKKMGIELKKAEKGSAILELQTKQDFTNSLGIIHGGIIASLCDAAMGAAVMTLGIYPITVEMKLNYLFPGDVDRKLVAIGSIVKKGRTFMIIEGEVYHKDQLIAKSLGTYYVQDPLV